ncbi:MAG: DUF2834 domain-containing protein [Pseudomonadota bacterium]
MKNVYLGWAVIGTVLPYAFFLGLFHGEMIIAGFIPALFVNGPAGGFVVDLLITSFAFWTYLFTRDDGPSPWPFVILNLTIGLSCALPAYLYWREVLTERTVA